MQQREANLLNYDVTLQFVLNSLLSSHVILVEREIDSKKFTWCDLSSVSRQLSIFFVLTPILTLIIISQKCYLSHFPFNASAIQIYRSRRKPETRQLKKTLEIFREAYIGLASSEAGFCLENRRFLYFTFFQPLENTSFFAHFPFFFLFFIHQQQTSSSRSAVSIVYVELFFLFFFIGKKYERACNLIFFFFSMQYTSTNVINVNLLKIKSDVVQIHNQKKLT